MRVVYFLEESRYKLRFEGLVRVGVGFRVERRLCIRVWRFTSWVLERYCSSLLWLWVWGERYGCRRGVGVGSR